MTYRTDLETFTLETLPDLDVVTLGALELFSEVKLPEVDFKKFKRPLVVGSVNGAATGRLLFSDIDAVFADESSYREKLEAVANIDGAFLLSASGAKHAIEIARTLQERGIETVLLTNNEDAPARTFILPQNVLVFPKNREPYTYNTSTYMGFFLSKTQEDPAKLLSFISDKVLPVLPSDFARFKAFCLIVPPHYNGMREMLVTKFDELFGPMLVGRAFTTEQMKHAKTVIHSDDECFISFGEDNMLFGAPQSRITIPLPHGADYVAMMAIAYFVIGHIQKQFPPYFKENIAAYTESASKIFGSVLTPIVE